MSDSEREAAYLADFESDGISQWNLSIYWTKKWLSEIATEALK